MLYRGIENIIGGTPLLELCRIKRSLGIEANIFAKLEGMNPAGSAKDRVALSIIRDAVKKGILKEGGTVIEPTSGNTGIGLAAVCAALGYRAVIVMPDSMSPERQRMIKAYGAKVVLTPGDLGMEGAIEKAKELKEEFSGSIIAGQFENPANPAAHYETTGPEIYRDLQGKVDIFAAGIGTGGTISGTGRYLKEKNPALTVVGIEPESSAWLSRGEKGKSDLQGIGAGFTPKALDMSVYDEIITICDEDAYSFGRMLSEKEGVFAGITSGAALCAAVRLAKRKENAGKNIVIILPDSGDRYLSAKLFDF